jgi:putative phosphoribosyl transferase
MDGGSMPTGMIIEIEDYRDRVGIFRDRDHAGEVLAGMLAGTTGGETLVCSLPAGGVPVGVKIAANLGIPHEVAVVSKITLPWNSEAGYGAVAFDGTVRLNERLLPSLRLSDGAVRRGIEETERKVRRRVGLFRGKRPFPELGEREVLLVDDGLASGLTMETAVAALRKAGSTRLAVAVPTGQADSVSRVAEQVDKLFCPNIRRGFPYAVAAAYRRWRDISEEEALGILGKGAAP